MRITIAAAAKFSAQDYITAQRIRRRTSDHFDGIFRSVDVLATPAAPVAAPRLHPASERHGESNLPLVGKLMRYAQLASFLGTPAVALPVGLTDAGLPVGCAP